MNTLLPNRRVRILAGLWLILLFLSIGLILFFITTSPASASISSMFVSPTPTQENLWAYANIPKSTHALTAGNPAAVTSAAATLASASPATEMPASVAMELVQGAVVIPTQGAAQQVSQPAPSYGGSKRILVNISEQHMYGYDGDKLVYSFVASTGIHNATRVGQFAVQSKIPNAWGSTWSIWMPYWLGIYYAGGLENGIHALPILPSGATLWEGFLGRPISYGCVVLGTYDAQQLYDWAEMGTPVEIQR
jgi:lipoprotein-anchoring transpeptidase ErfK/SrfK